MKKKIEEMQLPKKEGLKFVLMGHNFMLYSMVQLLHEKNFAKPIIVTHPKEQHSRDRTLFSGQEFDSDVFEVAKKYSLEIIEAKTVNSPELIEYLVGQGVNIGFSLSCRSIIKSNLINALNRRVFNLHDSFLPLERGAVYSYRIMNNIHEVSATLHLLDEGIDTGDIIFQDKSPINIKKPYPSDYERETQPIYRKLLERFLDTIERGEALKLFPQENDKSTYLPRLYTELNGAIDWSWSSIEVEQFIRAFGPHYPGAFTFIGEQRIHLRRMKLEPSPITYHPFITGKILTVLKNGTIKVSLYDHFLIVEEVMFENKIRKPAEVCDVRQTFYTPTDFLIKARLEIPQVKNMSEVPNALALNHITPS